MASTAAVLWNNLRWLFGENDLMLHIAGTFICSTVMFWGLNMFLIRAELTGKPEWLRKFRTQDNNTNLHDRKLIKKTVDVAVWNQTYLGIPSTLLFAWLQLRVGCSAKTEDLPSFFTFLWHVTACLLIQEVFFYYSHRLVHYGPLYKRIHKMHHEWTAPISIASVYAHPLEFLFSNVISVAIGPLLMRCHVVTAWVWYSLLLYITTIDHSGYHLPFFISPEFHDYHHLKFNENFGTLGILDWIHGTSKNFWKSVQFKRHRIIVHPTPVTSTYPLKARENKVE